MSKLEDDLDYVEELLIEKIRDARKIQQVYFENANFSEHAAVAGYLHFLNMNGDWIVQALKDRGKS